MPTGLLLVRLSCIHKIFKKFLALARWCAQSSASTTARSLRAIRSWVTGPDGLTQATLLTQTRAPSGERLRFFSKQTFDARFQKILDHLVVLLQVVLFDFGLPISFL